MVRDDIHDIVHDDIGIIIFECHIKIFPQVLRNYISKLKSDPALIAACIMIN